MQVQEHCQHSHQEYACKYFKSSVPCSFEELFFSFKDAFIAATSYWAIAWGLAYGEGGNLFCGGSEYFNYSMDYEKYPKWFFQVHLYTHPCNNIGFMISHSVQFVFAATAATIVSGSIAERCQFGAYFLYRCHTQLHNVRLVLC